MAVVGEIVAGRFRLVRPVGTVWQAEDEILVRDVALKEILAMPLLPPARDDVWARTVREARTSARLTHPNIVRVYDMMFAGGRPWIVMEYVVGRTLEAAVKADGPFPPQEAARIGLALLDGLDAVHAAGVLHRDVRPHTVLLADDGRVLLGDFGRAVFAGEPSDDVVLGAPGYLAPERINLGASNIQTDLWSLGATLHFAAEGRAPDPNRPPGVLAELIRGLLRPRPEERLSAAEARKLLHRLAFNPGVPDELSPKPAPAVVRPRRAARLALVAGIALAVLGGTTAGAVTVAGPSLPLLASAPSVIAVGLPYPRPLTCNAVADPLAGPASPTAAPVPLSTGAGPASLPAGWVWHLDDGFRIGLPGGWLRGVDGTAHPAACLLDPGGRRAVSVDGTASLDPDRVAHWQREETQLLAGRAPDGYERVDISPALYRKGGADWEYRYEAGGVRWHVLRRAFAIGTGRAFVVSWTTPDEEWDRNQADFRAVMQSFDLR